MDFYHFLASSSGFSRSSHEQKRKDHKEVHLLDYIWILGNRFIVSHDKESIRAYIRSKIWCSYRNQFPPIGGTGPVTDKRWGCMLRCGQMVMAEALIRRHLGRNWIWDPVAKDPVYLKILGMFQDKKDSPYSIHQIAQMGVSEGKMIGQWFGPNTVAQVLRKLAVYDEWSNIAVHVALDNAVIIEDIKTICKSTVQPISSRLSNPGVPIVRDPCGGVSRRRLTWRPMLLFIPLRLGLNTLNPVYARAIKRTFMMRQTVGIIGGKPSHALWFIGFKGNDLLFLDPHTTQPYVNLDSEIPDDSSFHIPHGRAKRVHITDIDPSIALCFYFENEEDFDTWCRTVHESLILLEKPPLFELEEKRPSHWPRLEVVPDINPTVCSSEFYFVEKERRVDDSDDDFEIFDPVFVNHSQQSDSAENQSM